MISIKMTEFYKNGTTYKKTATDFINTDLKKALTRFKKDFYISQKHDVKYNGKRFLIVKLRKEKTIIEVFFQD